MSSKMNNIVNMFVDSMKNSNDKKSSFDTTAEVKRVENGIAYVHFNGGANETPVKLTMDAKPGDVVKVRVSGKRAFLQGNSTAPPTDDTTAIRATNRAISAQETADTAKNTAEEAQEEAKGAFVMAETAKKVADDTEQHFWFTETGTDTGAHITEKTQEDFLDDPTNGGGNLLARSNGIAVRQGLVELASFTSSGAQIGFSSGAHSVIDVNGQRFYGSNGTTQLANIGYGDTYDDSHQLSTSPYYTLGTRALFNPTVAPSVTPGSYSTVDGTANIAYGAASHAEGHYTEAVGGSSHAEGSSTYAIGDNAHSEGMGTYAKSADSHAEGRNTKAGKIVNNETYGYGAHAEGNYSEATGNYSHAEGDTTKATELASHAEGRYSEANGIASHAQNMSTKASSSSQTAIGRYNIEDANEQYALIVGNGSYDTSLQQENRSNALTVDWSGNVETAGDITDGSGNVLSEKVDSSALLPLFKTVSVTATVSNISANSSKNASFAPAAQTGYTRVGIVGWNTANIHVFIATCTGTTLTFANASSSTQTCTNAQVTWLFIRSSL